MVPLRYEGQSTPSPSNSATFAAISDPNGFSDPNTPRTGQTPISPEMASPNGAGQRSFSTFSRTQDGKSENGRAGSEAGEAAPSVSRTSALH